MFKIKNLIFLFVFSFSVCLQAEDGQQGHDLNANEEITLLISQIEKENCKFHRNGKTYSAQEAANHLRLKVRRGTRYAKTTEGFIEKLASKSSFSGKPYYIECQQAELISMATWLNTELASIRNNIVH